MHLHEAVEAVQQRARKHEAFQASCVPRREQEGRLYRDLFESFEAWLKPWVAEGKIQTNRMPVSFVDSKIGEMSADALSVRTSPCAGIEVVVAPTGLSAANIRHEVKMRRADALSRAEDYYIYKLVSEGEAGHWHIARRSVHSGRPKILSAATFEDAMCSLFMA